VKSAASNILSMAQPFNPNWFSLLYPILKIFSYSVFLTEISLPSSYSINPLSPSIKKNHYTLFYPLGKREQITPSPYQPKQRALHSLLPLGRRE
jgi:hypothetical protein